MAKVKPPPRKLSELEIIEKKLKKSMGMTAKVKIKGKGNSKGTNLETIDESEEIFKWF